MVPQTCDKCGVSLPASEGHYSDQGFICDTCYFSDQPWHNDDDNGRETEAC